MNNAKESSLGLLPWF